MNVPQRIPPSTWWIIWFTFNVGICLTLLVVNPSLGLSLPEWAWLAPLALLVAAVVVRWFVYPRSTNQQQQLVSMIVGCHLVELGALASTVVPDRISPMSFLTYALPVMLLYCPYFLRPWQSP